MATQTLTCPVCDSPFTVSLGDFNRSQRGGYTMSCSTRCQKVRRRKYRSAELDELSAEDYATYRRRSDAGDAAAYAKEYYAKNRERVLKQQAVWYQANKAAIYASHKERMTRDPEYAERYAETLRLCRERPEWKAKKRAYDRRRREAKKLELALGMPEIIERIATLDVAILDGLTRGRMLAGPVEVPCPMCVGSGCVRCGKLGKMPYGAALDIMCLMGGRTVGALEKWCERNAGAVARYMEMEAL